MDTGLNDIFFALADPTRRAILGRLVKGSATVGALAEPFAISAPAISKHLKILGRAGLIKRNIVGREHHCQLHAQALEAAEDWLRFHRAFWETRLDELEAVLQQEKT